MLLISLTTILFGYIWICEGIPMLQEEYRGSYVPTVLQTSDGLQIVAPDTPYVAAAGRDKLYFIDTRFDTKTARHIKEQIEWATVPRPNQYISIDEFSATAEVRSALNGETLFVFDPPYARVMFAKGINRHNKNLKLPEHKPAGDWEVTYDIGTSLTKKRFVCSDYGCSNAQHCEAQTNGWCGICHHYRVDSECDVGLSNAIGACFPITSCSKAVDTPKEDGETDASYYQRMDRLHWE